MGAPLNYLVKRGASNVSVLLRFQNLISFVPQTSFTAAQAGLVARYYRVGDGTDAVSIACTSLATVSSSHTDGGFQVLYDGFYRLDVPDAAFAANPNINGGMVNQVLITATITGAICDGALVQLIDGDKISAPTPQVY